LSADVKVYQTLVSIKESLQGLKPGMSAEVTLYTDDARDNCLAVPVQAILGSVDMGNKRRLYVMTEEGPEARECVIGLSNDKMAEVISGVTEGEQVVVNPRVLLSEKEKAQFGDSGPYRYRSGEEGKGGKGGKGAKGGKGGKGEWPKKS